ncbi:hypothetical protein DERF_008632 [Dermatophagoides farinae]|uniref:Uncharacterized protein n=1 Tax=Dermatophagoides farinae TaxID=6954 RepID=A0A922I648_DERFA|nr:hypothetical protein DERF_008632 [Dermatophagoides farinae]
MFLNPNGWLFSFSIFFCFATSHPLSSSFLSKKQTKIKRAFEYWTNNKQNKTKKNSEENWYFFFLLIYIIRLYSCNFSVIIMLALDFDCFKLVHSHQAICIVPELYYYYYYCEKKTTTTTIECEHTTWTFFF